MTLGIIILNWNQTGDTIACAQQAQRWAIEDKRIWVVDNGSRPEEARALAGALPGVEIIFSPLNRGFAGGNNLALSRALKTDCQAVLLFNNDAQADGEAIAQLRRTLEQHSRIGIIGPVLVDAANPQRVLSAGGRDIARHIASHILNPIRPGELRFVDYVPGTCAMMRADVLRALGLLDEEYFFGGEVADLCARARQKDWLCAVDGSATVRHAVDRSAIIRKQLHLYYVIRNRFLYIRKFYPRWQLALFAAWTIYSLYTASLALVRRQPAQARVIGLGCLDGWRGWFGGQNGRVTRGEIL
jgi:GT2 family glycosyltransferase